jgi:hypothetical protein
MLTYCSIYFLDSGWTDSFNCEWWLKEVFIPFAKGHQINKSKPIVLFMDGHKTHETPDLQHSIYKHLDDENLEIIIFCFPSKTTHKCQPLDVAVFSQIQHKWQDTSDEYTWKRTLINHFTVIPAYLAGTQSVLMKELIAKAFEKTGLYPVNHEVFQDEDFTPSKATSSVAPVPPSFPADVPLSDPVELSDTESMQSDSQDEDYESSIDKSSDSCSGYNTEEENSDNDYSDHGTQHKNSQRHPMSSLVESIANIETGIIHMTHSATAHLDLFTAAPLKTMSIAEDSRLSPDE